MSLQKVNLNLRARTTVAAWLLAILGSLTFISGTIAQEIIVNPQVSKEDLSKNAVRAIFGMRLRVWPDGTPIRVFVLDDQSQVHIGFSKGKLDIFPHQLRRAWDRLVYSGTGQAPIQVASPEEMRARVASTPGAIGYLWEEMIDDSVRIVEVQ